MLMRKNVNNDVSKDSPILVVHLNLIRLRESGSRNFHFQNGFMILQMSVVMLRF